MDKGLYLRFAVVVIAVLAAWGALWPSLDRWVPAPKLVEDVFPGRMSPGLDIKGGLRLVYGVEIDEAIRARRNRTAEDLLERLGREMGVIGGDAAPTRKEMDDVRERVHAKTVGEHKIRLEFEKSEDAELLNRDFLQRWFPDLREVNRTGTRVTVVMREQKLDALREKAIEQTERTIRNRIDELQIRETEVIGREAYEDIIVKVPGADESMFERIRSIISRTARLDFKIVDDEGSTEFIEGLERPEGIDKETEVVSAGKNNPQQVSTFLVARGENARNRLKKFVESVDVPDDHQFAIGRLGRQQDSDQGQEQAWRTYYLFEQTEVTGEDIEDAFVSFDRQNQPVVAVHFDTQGATDFEQLTGRNVKRRMAIVLDDVVESAPVIQTEIGGGRGQITLGGYRDYNELKKEAQELVIVLRAGALPAPIRPENEQLIGPTLGHDSVKRGAQGAVIGITLVIIFMAFYYQVGGFVSVGMVVLNLLFLMAIMAGFEATLTLPGVAAIALTVGMAVDANVLIIERVREELRLGKSPRSSVDQGYRRAFWSIFDSQVTTFIAGVVLFQYGTGPIKGFAVMLMIGIITSLFTGVFCSKVFLDWIVRGLRVQRLRVG